MNKHISVLEKLFNKNCQLIDGTDEIFELDLALWEYENLSKEDLMARSAYFKLIYGKETIHYKMCNLQNLEEVHRESSFRTKIFFLNGKYSTGYATHGLFPYRGKFHPQLIRAILNILNIKRGSVVLDPMAGSSTVTVEANLLGIDAISVDVSPFCQLIGKVKTFSLNLDIDILENISKNSKQILTKLNRAKVPKYFNKEEDSKKAYYEVLLLAFLDAVGFSGRTSSSLDELFPRVLKRYITTIKYFQYAREKLNLKIGKSRILQGSVTDLPLKDNSVDSIITSPPYSFAIDYLKNDKPQLEYLDANLNSLRSQMIGLQGRGIEEKLRIYFDSMQKSLYEMNRVLKNNSSLVIVIGSNDIQTKGIRLETKIIEFAKNAGFNFSYNLIKSIRGMQNSMKKENVLFFTKKD
ncbi:MAG: hypothetical protein LBS61_05760 [Endomicrobium sp.]|jgi:DNA modification methylase|nr:hypothetical protein [Endomicrobium sp.]